ncbi:hypothetical protein Hbl1158_10260 [Halobaculum sp. CBA1158]|uniref:hypothetical protein n=1 Tax=Halobaculum sp. CBA1158 TaxID=2904243 RepID=UPI001F27B796|nr:hypothetical protein [Halobaculum sp. CBA1158]UIO98917.1 hypothetical protein Hbl1158_10260 [Halobaculum sp. CBA1158]
MASSASHTTVNGQPLDETASARAARALLRESALFVYPDDPAAMSSEVAVYSGASRYLVDPEAGRCDCDDAHYRQVDCKHVRRARMELGDGLPEWVTNETRVDPLFGALTRGGTA